MLEQFHKKNANKTAVHSCAARLRPVEVGEVHKYSEASKSCVHADVAGPCGGGLVFLKEGLTSTETFWLHRTGRGEDTWVLQRPAEGPG